MNIKFDSEPVYGDNDKYIKTKIKIYDGNVIFKAKKVPKENASYKCLSLIMLSFVVRSKERVLFPNSFGRVQIWDKKTKMENLINDELESSSSDNESDNESDFEPSNATDNESDNE